MPPIDVVIETAISTSIRAQQLSSMFDVPAEDRARLEWHGEFPIETKPWHVGLIVRTVWRRQDHHSPPHVRRAD